jgi:hypothetical protein
MKSKVCLWGSTVLTEDVQPCQTFLPVHLLERGGDDVPMPDSGSSRSTEPRGESESESRELLCCGEHDEDEELVDLLSSSSSVWSSREEVETQVKLELRESGGEVCVLVSTAASGLMVDSSVCFTTQSGQWASFGTLFLLQNKYLNL